MTKWMFAVAATLAIAFSVPAARAGETTDNATAPHITRSAARPSRANRMHLVGVTKRFDIHIHGSAIKEISIDLPQNINVTRGVEIADEDGRTVETTVSINDRRVTMVFSQPVPADKTLKIALRGVRSLSLFGRTWLYPIYVRAVGMNEEIPLGLARIQTYD